MNKFSRLPLLNSLRYKSFSRYDRIFRGMRRKLSCAIFKHKRDISFDRVWPRSQNDVQNIF